MGVFMPCPWCGAERPRAIGAPDTAPCQECVAPRETSMWSYETEVFNRGSHVASFPIQAASGEAALEQARRFISRSGPLHGRATHFVVTRVEYVTRKERLAGEKITQEVRG